MGKVSTIAEAPTPPPNLFRGVKGAAGENGDASDVLEAAGEDIPHVAEVDAAERHVHRPVLEDLRDRDDRDLGGGAANKNTTAP